MIKALKHHCPIIDKSATIMESAVIVGDVIIGAETNIWFHAVIRGDVNAITIGDCSNIQDHATLHCTYKKAALNIGNRVSIGHRAIVHGCTIMDEVLIGMGAIIMDHVFIPSHCLIAAGAVVTEGQKLKEGWLYAGVPAKPIKPVGENLLEGEIKRIAQNYFKYSSWYE